MKRIKNDEGTFVYLVSEKDLKGIKFLIIGACLLSVFID